jgi:hypothetical protein
MEKKIYYMCIYKIVPKLRIDRRFPLFFKLYECELGYIAKI